METVAERQDVECLIWMEHFDIGFIHFKPTNDSAIVFPFVMIMESGTPEIAVDEQGLFSMIGESGCQIARNEAFPFSGKGACEQDGPRLVVVGVQFQLAEYSLKCFACRMFAPLRNDMWTIAFFEAIDAGDFAEKRMPEEEFDFPGGF